MIKVLSIATSLLLAVTGSAHAVQVTLHSSNQGISSIAVNVTGTLITIDETWTSAGPGFLEISDLEPGTDYTIVKNITNNSGEDWSRLANELLDPEGQTEDSNDILPYPGFVPAGFTTSNDTDGLSFAQGSGIPRTSNVFLNLTVDELSDARDFLDFFDGNLANGGTGTVSYGLRENDGTQQPFLLSQRPNAFSTEIPEPSSVLLLGSGLIGLWLAKFRKQSR